MASPGLLSPSNGPHSPLVRRCLVAWLDLASAADYTSLSVRTLRRFIGYDAHPLPVYLVGGKWLCDSAELDEWIRGFPRGQSQVNSLVDEILGEIGEHKRARPRRSSP
jgi:hypothetical protein